MDKHLKTKLLIRHNWWVRRYNKYAKKIDVLQQQAGEDQRRGVYVSPIVLEERYATIANYRMDAIEALFEVDAYDKILEGKSTVPEFLR